jgi:hypothetical protein
VQSLNIDGKTTNNTQTIANAFNDYFLSLAEQHDDNVNNDNNGDNDDNCIYAPVHYLVNAINKNFPNIRMKPTTIQEIENMIKSLKPKNTFGYDEIPTILLKLSSVYVSSYM